jgi:uncharacterized protein (TIGR02147 family)
MAISVFNYFNYQEFLKDFYREKKQQMPFFSYRLIAQSVGMDSSYLIRVLNGTLHINTKKIPAFINTLKLSVQEAAYFEALVNFNKAKSESQRKIFFEKLFKISRIKSHCLGPSEYEFFRAWYYTAVWSLIQMKPRSPDFRAIADACEPRITTQQASEAVKLLTRLGLVRTDEQGRLVVTDNHITAPEKWSSLAITAYLHEMILRADSALETIGKEFRDISSVTVTFREKNIEQIRTLIADFRKSIIALTEEQGDPDRAYQVNIQFFPITRDTVGRQ